MPSWLASGSFASGLEARRHTCGRIRGERMAKHEQITFTLEYGMDVISSALEHLNAAASKHKIAPLLPVDSSADRGLR